jgi:predicted permease
MVEAWAKEIRVAIRTLLKRPAFVSVTVGTLAIGIGATAAIFSVINGALLQPLPFPDPDRLVWISEGRKDRGAPGGSDLNEANLADLRASVRTIQIMAPFSPSSVNLSGSERAERIQALRVGQEFFQTLGVQPFLGRDFFTEEDMEGGPDVSILSFELWQNRFGGDPNIIGESLRLNSAPFTVVGVLPPGMEFPGSPRVFLPLQFEGRGLSRNGRQMGAIGRLAEGFDLQAAREDLMEAYARLESEYPEQNGNWSAWATPLHELIVRPSERRSLGLLSWAVGAVLLVAVVNVATLLLVRAETRHRELALRMALGAGGSRLVPHFLVEGLIIAVGGGAIGVAIAYWGVEAMGAVFSSSLPRAAAVNLDGSALLFTLVVSVTVGILVGLVPALRMRSVDLQADLREGTRGSSSRGSTLRTSLVVSELGLAVVLLSVAGLLLHSYYRVVSVDTGLDRPETVLVSRMALESNYGTAHSRALFVEDLLERVEAMPGVVAAGVSNRVPLYGGTNFTDVPVVGNPDRVSHFVEWRMVTPGFFDAVGITLEEGRMLTADDAADDPVGTVLITRELARQLFPEESPVGRRIDPFDNDRGLEVVGVVSDLRDLGHERPAPPGMYAAFGNSLSNAWIVLIVKAVGDPRSLLPQLRAAVSEIDPDLPLYGTLTLDEVVDLRLADRRFSISLVGIFAAVALLLGTIGIYGVVSFAVSQRTREMGIRLALGAEGVDVVRLVLGQGLRLTSLGLGIGLCGALLSTHWISAHLYGVEATDPVTYLGVALLLGGVSLLASYMPARRASRTNPLDALRAE